MFVFTNQQWQVVDSLYIHDSISYQSVTKGFVYKNKTWQLFFSKTKAITYINNQPLASANIFELMGKPTEVAHYVFINNAQISATYGKPALRTGLFPTGASLSIINNNYIRGHGGNGGNAQQHGAVGGDALCIDYPCEIDNSNGFIYGGGGGGGGVYGALQVYVLSVGGGGGAGSIVGLAGENYVHVAAAAYYGVNPSNGGLNDGGAGGEVGMDNGRQYVSGSGGSVGQAGTASRRIAGTAKQIERLYAGGAAGLAINKNGHPIALINKNTEQIKGNIK